MPHHVRLCLEGLPLQAWDAQAVASAIGTNCSIDYIEPASCLKTDTEALCLWAWATCPSKIPRVNWITLPAREGGEPVYGRRGLQHRVLLHLSIHEQKVGGRTVSEGFTWRRNIVDGETVPRDRRERISRPAPRHDRRDSDDDEDRRRGGDRRGRDDAAGRSSLGARIRRSLSRSHREEPRNQDRGRGDRDRREDRGNRRRDVVGVPAVVLQGSGSASSVAARSLEDDPAVPAQQQLRLGSAPTVVDGPVQPVLAVRRGRSPARARSPGMIRRRSQDNRTPPSSPPLSPTSVLPPVPRSKRDEARRSASIGFIPSHATLELCSPSVLLLPLASPARPPGFESSPTPPLVPVGPVRRTPSPPRMRVVVVADADLGPLFKERVEALLPTPAPRPTKARRKTMAGVSISRAGGFTLQRTTARLRVAGQAKVTPVAKAAEALVCRGLGITKNGQDVTVDMLNAFTDRFKEQLPPEVIIAMRDMFKLDDVGATAVEDALLQHGGAGALDVDNGQDAI
ncbi:hypothetical protein ACQJBY_007895 [Aegilops geniculata]